MRKLAIVAIVILLLPALLGCARTLQNVKTITADPATGKTQVYTVGVETAKAISKQILVEKGFIVQDQGNSLVARKTDFFYVEFTTTDAGTKVRAVAVRKIPTNILVELTEGTFHERLAEKIRCLQKKSSLDAYIY